MTKGCNFVKNMTKIQNHMHIFRSWQNILHNFDSVRSNAWKELEGQGLSQHGLSKIAKPYQREKVYKISNPSNESYEELQGQDFWRIEKDRITSILGDKNWYMQSTEWVHKDFWSTIVQGHSEGLGKDFKYFCRGEQHL